MAKKSRKKVKRTEGPKPSPPGQQDILAWFKNHPTLSAFLLFLVLSFIFFYDVLFGGKIFWLPDAQSAAALTHALKKYFQQEHTIPQWIPYIFAGMPSFGSLIYTPLVYFPYVILNLITSILPVSGLLNHIIHYPFAALGVFLFLRRKNIQFWGSLFGGIVFMFTPYLIIMEVAGHGSQQMTAAYIPWIFYGLDRLLEKRNLVNFAVAALLIGLQLQRGHVQIVYYTWMGAGLYVLYQLILQWRQHRQIKEVLVSTVSVIGALFVGFGLASLLYLSIYEYLPYSIRGAGAGAGGGGGGVGFDYATQWSFHPKEMLTFLIPSFFGFGGQTYWGAMPFTDYPNYMGILALMFAFFAFFSPGKSTVSFFAFLAGLALLISFGRHFSPLYKILYNYLPFFNKFRVPAMILIMLQFSVAVLAGFGLQNCFDLEKNRSTLMKALRVLTIVVAVIAGIFLILMLFYDAFFNFMNNLYPQKYQPDIQQRLNQIRFDMLIKDMWLMVFFLGAGVALYWALLKNKIKPVVMGFTVCLLTIVDLWIVDYKLNNPVSAKAKDSYLKADETINFLKRDKELFRIFPLTPLFSENRWAAHEIQSIGGYHPAKIKLFQHFMDEMDLPNGFIQKYYRVESKNGDQSFKPLQVDEIPARIRQMHLMALSLLNVKYIVAPYDVPEPEFKVVATPQILYGGQYARIKIYKNTRYLPRAFFVDSVQVVANEQAVLEVLKSGQFNPAGLAILEEALPAQPESGGEAQVNIEKYHIHEIDLKVNTDRDKLLVLSEVYYPPAWRAYIDGKPTKIYKTDFLLRSVFVPAGEHEIKFRYQSPAFRLGIIITSISYILIIVLLALQKVKRAKKINL